MSSPFKFGDAVTYRETSAVVVHINDQLNEVWIIVEGRPSFPKVVKPAVLKSR